MKAKKGATRGEAGEKRKSMMCWKPNVREEEVIN